MEMKLKNASMLNLVTLLIMGLMVLASCTNEPRERWFESSFELTGFLKEQAPEPMSEIVFQVCDAQRQPIPHGLLRFDWLDNGGRMSFQTDEEGKIAMRFEEDILQTEIEVSIDQKPEGQVMWQTESYDASTERIEDGSIRVSVH
jgi:hypothetical protein